MKKFLLLFISILTFSFLFTTNKTYAQEYLQGETWVINSNPSYSYISMNINFESNGTHYTRIMLLQEPDPMTQTLASNLYYGTSRVATNKTPSPIWSWTNEAYRTVTFETAPTGDLLTWLEASAVKVLVSNDGYDEGYQDGYDEGYQDGYDDGLLAGDYQEGYQEGYQDGFIAGEKSKIAKNNESFYKNIALWIPAVITVVALASIISYFGIKRKNE